LRSGFGPVSEPAAFALSKPLRQLREKAGSLSATEAFSAEVIYLLDHPTIGEFADFIGISQPNASYK
jgi:hypothetical protein